MPKFIDYHAQLPQMPPEMMQQVAASVKAGKADAFGVVPLNLFVGDGGQAYCLSEAPNAQAVLESHRAIGVPQESHNIVQVQSLA